MNNKNALIFLFIQIFICKEIVAVAVIDKGILRLTKHSVAIQFFIDVENKNHTETCEIYSRVKKCCLTHSDKEDCDVIDIYSETVTEVKPTDRQTIIYIFPCLLQHDFIGYCDMVLTQKYNRNIGGLNVHIPFDTRTTVRKRSNPILNNYVTSKEKACKSLDQDSLEKCSPTNCDIKYSGQRPFYEEALHRCVQVPICVKEEAELPDTAYVSAYNLCKDLDLYLTAQDIYAISNSLGTVTQSVERENLKFKLNSRCSTISQNLLLLKDLIFRKLCSCNEKVDIVDGCRSAGLSIILDIISICAALLSVVCCVLTSTWVYSHWSGGNFEELMKKLRCKLKRTRMQIPKWKVVKRNSLLGEVVIKGIPIEMHDRIRE